MIPGRDAPLPVRATPSRRRAAGEGSARPQRSGRVGPATARTEGSGGVEAATGADQQVADPLEEAGVGAVLGPVGCPRPAGIYDPRTGGTAAMHETGSVRGGESWTALGVIPIGDVVEGGHRLDRGGIASFRCTCYVADEHGLTGGGWK
jgi:hypothetical protein